MRVVSGVELPPWTLQPQFCIYNNTFTARRVGVGAAWSMILMIIIMGLAGLMMLRQRNREIA